VTALAFSADGKWLASGDHDRTIRLYDPAGPQRGAWQARRAVHSLAFSPDDRLVAAGCLGGVEVWEAATGRHLGWIATPGSVVNQIAFLSDGRTLLSANGDGMVRLHDVPRPSRMGD
jgi:WD40 repeat protein